MNTHTRKRRRSPFAVACTTANLQAWTEVQVQISPQPPKAVAQIVANEAMSWHDLACVLASPQGVEGVVTVRGRDYRYRLTTGEILDSEHTFNAWEVA